MSIGSRNPATHGSAFSRFWTSPTSLYAKYDEFLHELQRLAKEYPHLLKLEDIGDTDTKQQGTSDRDVLLLRVTGPRAGSHPKRKALFVAGQHGDEPVNTDLMLRWLVDTLPLYGTDPEVTAVLNACEFLMVPMANPDGRERTRRRNAKGLDTNRNFDVGYDPSQRPQSQPEVEALSELIERERPDVFADWHSFGRMFVLPWAYTKERPDQADQLERLATKLGTLNGYDVVWGSDLYGYEYSGTAHDFAHRLGIPALTIETCDSKVVSKRGFEEAWRRNRDVITYLGKIADAPYERVAGPDIVNIRLVGDEVRATATEETSGEDRIVAAEYVFDPATPPGQGFPMKPVDGDFDSAREVVRAEVANDSATAERRLIYVRSQDEHGHWGPLSAAWSTVGSRSRNCPGEG